MQFHVEYPFLSCRKKKKKKEKNVSINFPLTKKNYLERILDMKKGKKKKYICTFKLQDTVTKELKINVSENNAYCL